MRRKSKITILIWLAVIVAVTAIIVVCLSRTRVGESVRRESARLFDYEYIPNQNIDIDRCQAAEMTDSIYRDFRKKYRFHYQTVGLASFADSSRLILLSDIPPHFETDSIAPIFAEFTHKTELRKHPIGYDGYTTDVVILLGNATQENCNRLIKRLNLTLSNLSFISFMIWKWSYTCTASGKCSFTAEMKASERSDDTASILHPARFSFGQSPSNASAPLPSPTYTMRPVSRSTTMVI